MSAENVELVRAALSQFGQTGMPTGLATADFVWDVSRLSGWLDEPVYHGVEGFQHFFAKWTEPYDEWNAQVEDVVDVDGERVIAVMHQRGRIKGTDAWVEQRSALLYTIRAGRFERVQLFDSLEEALAGAHAQG